MENKRGYMSSRTNMIKMGNHIADLRKKKKYTQKTLGDILDVSDKTISKWEKGVVAPDITILQSLANALDVSVEELLAGEEVQKMNTIEALDTYSNMTKNKLIKTFIVFIFLFTIIIFFAFRVEEYYSWHLSNLFQKGEISSYGFILSNNKESKVLINKIMIGSDVENRLIKEVYIVSKNKDESIFNKKIIYDNPINIKETLNNYSINIEISKKIEKKNLSLSITFVDVNNNNLTYHIKYK